MRLGIMKDPSFWQHRCMSYDHPECPERLDAVMSALDALGLVQKGEMVPAREAKIQELEAIHHPRYVSTVLETLERGGAGHLDPDTFFSPETHEAALRAVGGGIDLSMAVHNRDVDVGMVVARPPGHHATPNRSMGFCVFNNIAAAAASILENTDAEKVVIFDWDVHHGNGTQAQFWNNPNVLYISTHQFPFYPGTGHHNETGGNEAPLSNLNVALPGAAVDEDYLIAMDSLIMPLIKQFGPDHIFVSAGYDAHHTDPLAGMRLSTDCFKDLASRMKIAADQLTGGRLTLFLEGGYSLSALEDSVTATMNGIGNPSVTNPPSEDPGRAHHEIIRKLRGVFLNG